jgi:hypothetical protein
MCKCGNCNQVFRHPYVKEVKPNVGLKVSLVICLTILTCGLALILLPLCFTGSETIVRLCPSCGSNNVKGDD